MILRRFVFGLMFLGIVSLVHAQPSTAPENWFTLDKEKDGVQGTSADEALRMLKSINKKGQTIIVAVLDSGVEVDHDDLKNVMWVNEDEIPGNGIDDDNNGYIDDIHGWNFIGGKDGRNVDHDTYELTREYVKLSKRFDGADPKALSKKDRKQYEYYQDIKAVFEEKRGDLEAQQQQVDQMFGKVDEAFAAVKKATGKSKLTADDLEKVDVSDNAELEESVSMLKRVFAQGMNEEDLEEQKKEASKYFSSGLNYGYSLEFNPRDIVGDDYSNLSQRGYGNNDYEGPDAFHGTHVSGIIAAQRDNDTGVRGVADNVRIMTVRCVPDGDERDKDVANAIRYAVDNGASIINMSFGKGYSPEKWYVDEAVKYAAEHDVLLVHAAGNDSENNDTDPNFPNDKYENTGWFKPKNADNWLEVGALHWREGERSVASFSNFGKKNVDLFSPGVAIYSTVPDNGYGNAQGTSMASPAAAGVAAIVRSYYPELSAKQVREILIESAVKSDALVYKPGTTEKVKFSELSVSGGVISATNAIQLASKTKGKKNKKATWQEEGKKQKTQAMP